MTLTTNQATAADFEPYVEAGRAEGLNDAEIVERWMREARPEGKAWREDIEVVAIDIHFKSGAAHLWAIVSTPEVASLDSVQVFSLNTDDDTILAEEIMHNPANALPAALAWLANQLRERCPVAAGDYPGEARVALAAQWHIGRRPAVVDTEWCLREIDKNDEAAALIRRQYAISELEVTNEQ